MTLFERITHRLMNSDDILSLSDMHPFDLIALYNELDDEGKEFLLTLLNEDTFAQVLSYLEPEKAAEILEKLEVGRQTKLLNLIDPDDAADIISELPEDISDKIVDLLGDENSAVALLKYDEDEAGSLMNNRFVSVLISDDVKSATKKVIKLAGEVSSIQTIFVTDEEGKYSGQMPLKTLLKAKPPLMVSDLVIRERAFVDKTPREEIIDYMSDYGEHDMPIVDAGGKLLGVITASDIIETFHEEAIEDFSKLSALPDIDFKQGIFKSAIRRLPWLLGLLVLSIVIALITAQFEAVISATIALAFFQPLILDVGGDVASQTLAVTLIALNKNEDKDLKRTGRKEIGSGLLIAISLAVVSFLITVGFGYLTRYSAPFMLALVVSMSLIATVIIGLLFGFFVPVVLDKIKLDPAVASGPFITTSIDILSLLIYFLLALLIL